MSLALWVAWQLGLTRVGLTDARTSQRSAPGEAVVPAPTASSIFWRKGRGPIQRLDWLSAMDSAAAEADAHQRARLWRDLADQIVRPGREVVLHSLASGVTTSDVALREEFC